MKKTLLLVVLGVGLVGWASLLALAQQPAGPMPSPPTPGGKLPEKPQPLQPAQPGASSTPLPAVQTPGGIPRLPLPGTLPGGPGQVTPYGTQLGTPSQQIPQPAGLPSAVVPGG
ncbi:MAG: hypothetical protein RMI90_10730, partial [Thermoguttaceae bacterium]|nr:hypothetical protein [Thermoguttaceae bacterium]